METNMEQGMLDLLIRPGFYVQNHTIVYANQAAQALLLSPGMEIRELPIARKIAAPSSASPASCFSSPGSA